jgi:hypothetical protein
MLLSKKLILAGGPADGVQVPGTRVRLFLSPVVPDWMHVGAEKLPVRASCTPIVTGPGERANVACGEELVSPKMLNSA